MASLSVGGFSALSTCDWPGELAATVFQDAAGQGGGAVDVAVKTAKGQKMPKETWIPFKLVTPENLSQFKK